MVTLVLRRFRVRRHSVGSAVTGLPKQLFQRRPMCVEPGPRAWLLRVVELTLAFAWPGGRDRLSNTVDKDWRFNPALYVPNLQGTSAAPAAALGDVPLAPRPSDLEAPAASVEDDAPASS